MGLFAVAHLAARHGVRVRLQQASPRGLTALVWIPQTLITTESAASTRLPGAHAARPPEVVTGDRGATGWSAFGSWGRHRSIRKAVLAGAEPASAAAPAVTEPLPVAREPVPVGAEPVPIYESMASEWFRRGGQVPVQGVRGGEGGGGSGASWDSPGDAGWRAAESAAAPVRGELTAAGLPRRIPRANMVPGSAGERQPPAGDDPGGRRRSADVTRTRLAGFQRGTRRAESAAGSRAGRPAGG
jgi:hypothetical protein